LLAEFKGLFRTPCFYYGIISLVILAVVYFGASRLPKVIALTQTGYLVAISDPFVVADSREGVLFSTQVQFSEAPDLKIVESDSLAAFAVHRVLSTKVLGSYFGQGPQVRSEITDYAVQAGDTIKSIAESFDVSQDTILNANDLSKSSKLKTGQKLVILPVSGLVHIVKSGDTITSIAKLYKADAEAVVDVNQLAHESDIYIGDFLVVPDGVMPKKAPVYSETLLADNYFIFPVEGKITQALHWYNGVDVANKCGTPVYVAAPGTVLKAKYDPVSGGGNVVTVLHKDGVVTWYGHMMTMSVKPGDKLEIGDKIGLMGGQPGMAGAGISTGCHLHFSVIGAKNPLRNLPFGYVIKYN